MIMNETTEYSSVIRILKSKLWTCIASVAGDPALCTGLFLRTFLLFHRGARSGKDGL